MREIKYCGKRVDNGKWVYGSLIEDKYIVGNVVDWEEDYFNTEFWWKVIPKTVGQFTGKKDDGEDEIYTEDIISFDYVGEYCIGVVYWREKELAFMVENKTSGGYVIYLSEVSDAITKLGNIHDNPELLEVSNA